MVPRRMLVMDRVMELVMHREPWCAAVHWGFKELDMTEQLNRTEKNTVTDVDFWAILFLD